MSVPPDSTRVGRTTFREDFGGRSSLGKEGLGLDAGWPRRLACRVQPEARFQQSFAGRVAEWTVIVALVATICWFFVWTVDPEGTRPVLDSRGQGYYNLLARGFLKGQTALDVEVSPAMLAVSDPYSPKMRAGEGLHDASYYKGRYFIYFGVTPVVTIFAPVRLLTGEFVDERFAIVGMAIMGFIFSAATLVAIRRRHFRRAPVWVVVVAVTALGLATMVPPLLRRPSIWEVPIAAGYGWFMVTLFCVWRSLAAARGKSLWLAAASLAMGLTVGARPTYLLASVVLLAPLAAEWGRRRERSWRWLLGAAFGPILAAGVGLAAYNFARFGSLAEFGQTYQLAGDDLRGLKLFSTAYMAYNFRIYVLAAAGLSPYFPFITVIDLPPALEGQFGTEDPYGLVPCLPWVLLASAAWMGGRENAGRLRRRIWVGVLGLAALATMAIVFCFGGTCGRYMVDFTPALALLAGVGALAWTSGTNGFGRWIAGLSVLVLGIWSAGFGLLASFQHNRLLKIEYPEVYRTIAYAGNLPGYWLDRITGQNYGPVEMEVVFPRGAVGRVEPLVVTGRTFLSDYVYVHYLADERVRFGFEHTSMGGAVGEPVAIVPGATQKLRIEMGSLYPPAAHPYYDAMPPGQARRRQRTVRVTMNDKVAFYRSAELFDAVARRPDVGTAAGRGAFKQPFSGKILGQRIVPAAAQAAEPDVFGPVVLTVTLPPFTGVRSEPLVSSGETGKGDVVYIKYLDARTVVFGYDHWGYGGFESDAVAVKPDEELVITVDYGALYAEETGPRDRVVVRLNGRIVADREAKFHPCTPDTVVVGANMVGASTAAAAFSGNIIKQQRTAP